MLTIKKNKIMKILATAFLFSLFSIHISFASTLTGLGQDENGNFYKIVHVYGDDSDPRDSYEDSSKKIADLVMEMKIRKKIPLINLVKKTKKKHLPKRFM